MFSLKNNDESFIEQCLNQDYRKFMIPKMERNRRIMLSLGILSLIILFIDYTLSISNKSNVISLFVCISIFFSFAEIDYRIKAFKLLNRLNVKIDTNAEMNTAIFAKALSQQRTSSVLLAILCAFSMLAGAILYFIFHN